MTSKTAFTDLFSDAASGYAAHRPRYPIELAEALAQIAPARSAAWDCGCGSGQLSTTLAQCFDHVIATDASREQIAEAASDPKIEYRVGAADASGIAAHSVDLAVAAQAAHWFDLPAYYAEVRRVAKPDAAIALVTYNLMRITPAIDAVVDDFYWKALPSYWPVERRHVDDGYRSLPFPFAPISMPGVEMRMQWSLADVVGYVETWSAVRAMAKAEGRAPIDAFYDRLRAAWGDERGRQDARAPITIRAGRVS